MYLKISDDEFADAELSYLEELLGCIDKILSDVHSRIKTSVDPESEGLCDKGEYFIGVGFCAMQRYLVDVLQDKGIDKGTALLLGPKTVEGLPISVLIHSAGNYWKHSPEWHIWMEKLDERSQKTIDRLLTHDGPAWYPLSEVLAGLCDAGEFSLLRCIPYLKKWRQAVDGKVAHKNA
jgi:hypothetical protein